MCTSSLSETFHAIVCLEGPEAWFPLMEDSYARTPSWRSSCMDSRVRYGYIAPDDVPNALD